MNPLKKYWDIRYLFSPICTLETKNLSQRSGMFNSHCIPMYAASTNQFPIVVPGSVSLGCWFLDDSLKFVWNLHRICLFIIGKNCTHMPLCLHLLEGHKCKEPIPNIDSQNARLSNGGNKAKFFNKSIQDDLSM